LHVLLYFSVFKLVLVIYPIKFILKMTNNIRDITARICGCSWLDDIIGTKLSIYEVVIHISFVHLLSISFANSLMNLLNSNVVHLLYEYEQEMGKRWKPSISLSLSLSRYVRSCVCVRVCVCVLMQNTVSDLTILWNFTIYEILCKISCSSL